eukprot:COSAG06_NODE_5959_length_3183_cov_6.510376_1_plen_69_part_00
MASKSGVFRAHNRHPAAARARRGEAPLRQRDCGHASKGRPHLGQLRKREKTGFLLHSLFTQAESYLDE